MTLAIPELSGADVALGGIAHMPKFDTLPDAFKDWFYNPHCKAISSWFYSGAERDGSAVILKGVRYAPKEGVDADKALRAIKAVLGSFEPKHEHKIAACGYMLSEWFEAEPAKDDAVAK